MKPERKSELLLAVTRSKAKMFEFDIPEEHHIEIQQDPAKLLRISIGLLGDFSAAINLENTDLDSLPERRKDLQFSVRFFNAYAESNLNSDLDPYLVLLGSASCYLCDIPGSATLLANQLNGDSLDLETGGLERLLLWLLQADSKAYVNKSEGIFGELIDNISKSFLQFFKDGSGRESMIRWATNLRRHAYDFGTPRQLLFGDLVASILRKKIENSTWISLPLYSGIDREEWRPVLQKESFIKEVWPAQHLLGRDNILKGQSTIVQMPTSAGKTKAIELIIRSAFLAGRVSLAIIVAPFTALCHEIRNSLAKAFYGEKIKVDELSDTLQTDFEITDLLRNQQILVVTPEKLFYVLRQDPKLAENINLLIFDEGHQFDSGTRGITYELLLTSLRSMIPQQAQKILISAVISNAQAIGEWLNGESKVVEGSTLLPTLKSVGFASWNDPLGRIDYVDTHDTEETEFFVPRVIEKMNLGRQKRERTDRYFPENKKASDIALYLGLKLAPNGNIAIFCGTKPAVATICEKAVDIIDRNISLKLPKEFSDSQEVNRLTYLHIENLGAEAAASQSCTIRHFFPSWQYSARYPTGGGTRTTQGPYTFYCLYFYLGTGR